MLKGTNAKIAFIAVFALLAFFGSQINFSRLVGAENQFFTLFQFFGPIAGAFLGPVLGALSMIVSQAAANILTGKEFSVINIARLLPMVFGAAYFGYFYKKGNWRDASIIVPLLAIAAFVLHPVGRTVWFYALFWTIPLIAKLFSNRLFFRSLGATFTAHAVGGAIWIYTVPMTAEQWIALIPVVTYERGLFALGITFSYIVFNTVLHKMEIAWKTGALKTEANYAISKKLFQLS